MYFEPTKKTYYRFPSTNSIQELDSKYYFPDKPSHSEINTRFDTPFSNHISDRDSFHD